jgi:hypothetical protein
MSNGHSLGGGEPVTSREGVVVARNPLGFSSLPRPARGSMEVEEIRNGG